MYVANPNDLELAAETLRAVDGIETVLDVGEMATLGLDHANSGELLAVASEGCWLGYQWWTDPKQAPDYANHVDIHNKPGFDPCELFFGWPPMRVSQDSSRIGGSHGGFGPGRKVAFASSIVLDGEIRNIATLAQAAANSLL